MICKIVLAYITVIGLISVFVCVYDKSAAKKSKRRVPEKTLFLLSAIGGSVAMYFTMRLIRHKTLHKRFMLGIPFIIVLQLSAVIGILYLTR